jgi:hypothetical protein
MEFLITTLNTSGFNFIESCIYRIGQPTEINLSHAFLWCSDQPKCHGRQTILFDGYLFNQGRFYHRLVDTNLGILDPESCDGVFCYGIVDQDIHLYTDPLGQYHLYYYLNNHGFAISNNIHIIADLCKHLGQALRKNIDTSLHNILTGGSLGVTTQYQEINCLRVGESITVRAGKLQLNKPKKCTEKLSYADALHIAEQKLINNFTAFLESVNGDINLDITAGNDSRLIFALAKRCNALDHVRVKNIMKQSQPDCNVATWFVEKYKLNGGKSLMTKPIGVAAINNAAYSAFLYGGCRDPDGSYLSKKTCSNHIHLSGKFGEIAGKTTTGLVDLTNIPRHKIAHYLSSIIIGRKDKMNVLDCLSNKGIDIVQKALIEEVQYLLDLDIKQDNLVSELYLQSRCRNHFGMSSVHVNRFKVAPDFLALKALVDCRRVLPAELQAANKVIFDLVYLLGDEEVLFAPSDKSWKNNIVPNHLLRSYQNQKIINHNSPPLAKFVELFNAENVKTDFEPSLALKEVEEIEKSTSKKFASEKHIKNYQQLIKRYIKNNNNEHVVFNYDFISQLVIKSPQKFSRIQSGLLGKLAVAFIWMSNEEMKVYLDN